MGGPAARSMPIYEYRCNACRHQFELLVLRTVSAAACPVCQCQDLEQLVSTCAVRSEATSQASLRAAHRKAAANRGARQRDEHQHLHEHFDDRAVHAPGQDVKKTD